MVIKAIKKKQTTRLIKVACPICGYTLRTTRAWLGVGMPLCPIDEIPMLIGEPLRKCVTCLIHGYSKDCQDGAHA